MARLARAEFRARRDEVSILAAFDGPERVQIDPGLPPAAGLRGRHGKAVARVVVLRGEIDDDIARYRQARDDAAVLGDGFRPRAQSCDRLGNALGCHRHGAGHAAEPCAERAEIHIRAIAVAGAGAGEGRKVAFARAIHEGPGGEAFQARMAGNGDGPHPAVPPFRGCDETGKHHGHAGRRGQVVEDGFHRFRLEGDEYAPVPVRPIDGALPSEALHDLFGDAANDAARRLPKRVEAAIGDDIAHRRGAAQAVVPFEKEGIGAHARAGDGGGHACRPAAGDDDVVVCPAGGHGRPNRGRHRKTMPA